MRPILLSLPILLTPLSALADDPAITQPTNVTSSTVTEGESVTMPAKRALIRLDIGINLSAGVDDGMGNTISNVGDPIQIAPDFWYGIDNKLTVGLVHSFVGLTGFLGFPIGSGICLGDNCFADYSAAGAVRYQFMQNKQMSFAVDGALSFENFDPFVMSAKLGVVGRYRVNPKIAIDVQPALFFGVTERDSNGEVLALPITANYALDKKLSLLLQTGILLPFVDAGDFFFVPLSVGANYMVNKQMMVYGAFSLFALAGGSAISHGIDGRSFTIGGGYAL